MREALIDCASSWLATIGSKRFQAAVGAVVLIIWLGPESENGSLLSAEQVEWMLQALLVWMFGDAVRPHKRRGPS